MAQDTIPATAIQPPSSRALAILSRNGHLDQMVDPFALWRAPFRLTLQALEGSQAEKLRALAVLQRIAPQADWFAARLHSTASLWVAWYERLIATPSPNPTVSPLTNLRSDERWVIVDTPTQVFRVPRGMYLIEAPQRTLLQSRP